MLVITRKENESISIAPPEGVDPSLTLRDVFGEGPIVVSFVHVGNRRVRLAIEAPALMKVWRQAPGTTARTKADRSEDPANAGSPTVGGLATRDEP